MKRFKIHTLLAALLIGSAGTVSAQDYEDDIYYNPDKAPKTTPANAQQKTTVPANRYQGYQGTYPAADTYVPAVSSPRTISVDEYNRRGVFASDTTAASGTAEPDFAYTRRIEQFYNPDVVTSSSDPELAQYYYAQPSTSSVNIIVNTPGYWGYPYYGSAWAWTWDNPYYNALYWGAYYPWYYGPSWSWSWGWNYPYRPGWGWRPGWGYAPSWGWTGTVRPNRPTGNKRPGYSRPATGTGSYRPGYGAYRPGNNGTGTYRPGNNNGSTRPGTGTYRPGNNNGSTRPGTGAYRPGGRGNHGNSGSTYRGSGSGYSRGTGGGYSGGGSRGGGGRGRH